MWYNGFTKFRLPVNTMVKYEIDISPRSFSYECNPDEAARSFPFYAESLGYFEAGSRYYTKRDGLNSMLIMYTVSGQGEASWLGHTARLTPGSAVLISCDTYHEYRTASDKPWIFHWVHLRGVGLEAYRAPLLTQITPVVISRPELMEESFHRLNTLHGATGVLALAETSHLLSGILLTMLRALTFGSGDSSLTRRYEVQRVAEYIQRNMAEPLSIDDFTRIANLSRRRLIELFHQQMGMPPYKYLQHCRINCARHMLRTSGLTVAEIAAQVGYGDAVSFIRHFKSITGMTPAQYRRDSVQLP